MNNKPARDSFISYVQAHERSWGMESYPGRPDLENILTSPVVAFWAEQNADPKAKSPQQERHMIALYEDLRDLEQYMASLIIRATIELPKRRLIRVFVNGAEVRVTSVKITFEEFGG